MHPLASPSRALRAAAAASSSTAATAAVLLAALVAAPPTARADDGADDDATILVSGELTARFRHFGGRDFNSETSTNFVTQRARLGVLLEHPEYVGVFIQVQDVRIWGEETDTLGDFSADGFDLHQGYLERNLGDGFKMRVGRQEIGYLNQRLIGNVGFVEQSRSFDGLRLMFQGLDDRLVVDAFYARTRHRAAANEAVAHDVGALLARYTVDQAFVPALLAVLDTNAATDRLRATVGAYLEGRFRFGLDWSAEFYYQTGSDANVDFAAWMGAARLRYTMADIAGLFVEVFGEALSGDDDTADATSGAFDTLFATNHKFYGEMDVFTNIPVHTMARGLLDVGGAIGFTPARGLTAQLTFHHFQVLEDRGGEAALGDEIDLKVTLSQIKHLKSDLVYAVFLPQDGLAPGGDVEHFVYTTLSATF